jgi:hypothetical protein
MFAGLALDHAAGLCDAGRHGSRRMAKPVLLTLVLSKQVVQRFDVGGSRSHRLSLRDEEIAGVAIRHLDLVAGTSQFFHLLQ